MLHSGCSEGIVTEGFTEEETFPLGVKGWGILGHVDELEKARGLRAGCSAYPELGKSVVTGGTSLDDVDDGDSGEDGVKSWLNVADGFG